MVIDVFKDSEPQEDSEALLRTAIALYERDQERLRSEQTAEQVLAELGIPNDYLVKARWELRDREKDRQRVHGTSSWRGHVRVWTVALATVFSLGVLAETCRPAGRVSSSQTPSFWGRRAQDPPVSWTKP